MTYQDCCTQANDLLKKLSALKDDVCFSRQIITEDGDVFAFWATLDTRDNLPFMAYDVMLNDEPVKALVELPTDAIIAYGTFVSEIVAWQEGGPKPT